MPLVRTTFTAAAGLLAAWAACGPAAAAFPGAAELTLSPDPVVLIAGTRVDDMNPQMRTAYIRGIQEELAVHEYQPGPADGIMGPMTRNAIRRYQRDAGLEVDGVATKELLDHLKFALPKVYAKPPPDPDRVVLEAQTRLQELGYYRGPLDGQTGPATREAARAYRYDAGLPVSGAVDAVLLEALSTPQPGLGQSAIPESADVTEEAAPQPLPEYQSEPPLVATPPAPAE